MLERDLEKSFRKKGIFGLVLSAWVVEIANKEGNGRFLAKTFRDGVLTVSAKIPPAHLQMELPRLIAAINRRLGRPLLSRIRIRSL